MNLLTVSETAALLRCSTRKLHRLRKLDGFPQRYTIGGSFRWDASEVEAWLRLSARDAQNPAQNAEQPVAAPVAAPQAPAPAQRAAQNAAPQAAAQAAQAAPAPAQAAAADGGVA